MKTFINGKKTPIIPPVLVNNNLISNFREKVNVFNNFFLQKYQPIASDSILPISQKFYTQNRLRDFGVDFGKIFKLINGLHPHKAHGHDGNSIQMLKVI